jgi:hypothetical protein
MCFSSGKLILNVDMLMLVNGPLVNVVLGKVLMLMLLNNRVGSVLPSLHLETYQEENQHKHLGKPSPQMHPLNMEN